MEFEIAVDGDCATNLDAVVEQVKIILDETDVKFSDKEEVVSDNIEPSKPAKKLCLQFRRASNYWKRQFDGRHSIGIRSKDWMSR